MQEDRQEEERQFLSKALVYCCFLQFRRIGEYIFPRAVLLCQTHQQLFTHSLSVLTRGWRVYVRVKTVYWTSTSFRVRTKRASNGLAERLFKNFFFLKIHSRKCPWLAGLVRTQKHLLYTVYLRLISSVQPSSRLLIIFHRGTSVYFTLCPFSESKTMYE